MRVTMYNKLNYLLADKIRREQETKELEEEISSKYSLEKTIEESKAIASSIVSKNEHVHGLMIYQGMEGTVYLKESEKKLS